MSLMHPQQFVPMHLIKKKKKKKDKQTKATRHLHSHVLLGDVYYISAKPFDLMMRNASLYKEYEIFNEVRSLHFLTTFSAFRIQEIFSLQSY